MLSCTQSFRIPPRPMDASSTEYGTILCVAYANVSALVKLNLCTKTHMRSNAVLISHRNLQSSEGYLIRTVEI